MLLLNLLLLQFCGFLLWLRSLKTQNVSIVDLFWGFAFVIVTLATAIGTAESWTSGGFWTASETFSINQVVLMAMVIVWGVRLSGYLAIRNWGKPEDHRYAAMRSHWGTRFATRSLITVFGLQASLIWFISLPIQMGLQGQSNPPALFVVGLALWIIGFSFESIGDWQMYRFKKDIANRGQVMDRGLWRYTRHPNYFGDFLIWWGIYLAAVQPLSWWWTVFAPVLMSFLLLRVSGVTLLESTLTKRIAGYEEYVAKTSPFLPWPPSKTR